MTSDGGKSFKDYLRIAWAWLQTKPGIFCGGVAVGIIARSIV